MRAPLICLALLAACNAPSPRFMGGETHELSFAGHDYTLHRKGDWVQIYRMGSIWGVSDDELMEGYRAVAVLATGCQPTKRTRNYQQTLVEMEIACDGAAGAGDEGDQGGAAAAKAPPA